MSCRDLFTTQAGNKLSPLEFPFLDEIQISPLVGLSGSLKNGRSTLDDYGNDCLFTESFASERSSDSKRSFSRRTAVQNDSYSEVNNASNRRSMNWKHLIAEVPAAPTGELILSQFFSGGLFRNDRQVLNDKPVLEEVTRGRSMDKDNDFTFSNRGSGTSSKVSENVNGDIKSEVESQSCARDYLYLNKAGKNDFDAYHEFSFGCSDSLINSNHDEKISSYNGRGAYNVNEFSVPDDEDEFLRENINEVVSYSNDNISAAYSNAPRDPSINLLQSKTSADVLVPDLQITGKTPRSEPRPTSDIHSLDLRPVSEIPKKFRHLFPFSHFNLIQSKALDDALYTSKSMVIGAPTGSGKTVIFELAILRLMLLRETGRMTEFKVIYMAPIKALVSERFEDWKKKFQPLNLRCCELTGDSDVEDYFELSNVHLILTTPEKWDFTTRRWRQNRSLVRQVKLFLIDEVHTIGDSGRGATLEAVVNRMKTVAEMERLICRRTEATSVVDEESTDSSIRFVAASATIPNIMDLAEWLGQGGSPAIHHRIDDSQRPVPLRKVVLGYDKPKSSSIFKFDLTLNYRLPHVLELYAEMKPAIVFCSTRKGAAQAAQILAKETRFFFEGEDLRRLREASHQFRDSKLADLVSRGLAYHHAGLEPGDRKLVEELFASGRLAVLLSTSTLAMGVNLPAHLVVVKSTQHYVMGEYIEYSESQVLQMIGRAGRPQFDTSATAVIMTQNETKRRYESMLNGTQLVESSLHQHLVEHLNAEIVLETIRDVPTALRWIESSYLFVRIHKNPGHYGINSGIGNCIEKIEKRLREICLSDLNRLAGLDLLRMDDDGFSLTPTEAGQLMSRYCVAFETVRNFSRLSGTESLADLLDVFCSSDEFKDMTLRTSEKKILNELNKNKNKPTIRYPIKDRIKTPQMKISCLVQAQLGCLPLPDFALQQDANKIFRIASRIARCLADMLWSRPHFKLLHSAMLLSKCFQSKLWENSKYVVKQLTGIGPVMATSLVNNGMTSFDMVLAANPRTLELMVNRQPPFGNSLQESCRALPRYDLQLSQTGPVEAGKAEICVIIRLTNPGDVLSDPTCGPRHACVLLVGWSANRIVCKVKVKDSVLMQQEGCLWTSTFVVSRGEEEDDDKLTAHLISQDWVGLDRSCTLVPKFLGDLVWTKGPSAPTCSKTPRSLKTPGSRCKSEKPSRGPRNEYERCLQVIKRHQENIAPASPGFKRLKTARPVPNLADFNFRKVLPKMPANTPRGGHKPLVPYSSGILRMNHNNSSDAVSKTSTLQRTQGTYGALNASNGFLIPPPPPSSGVKRFNFVRAKSRHPDVADAWDRSSPTDDDLLLVAAADQALAEQGVNPSVKSRGNPNGLVSDKQNFDLICETSFFEDEKDSLVLSEGEEEEGVCVDFDGPNLGLYGGKAYADGIEEAGSRSVPRGFSDQMSGFQSHGMPRHQGLLRFRGPFGFQQ